MSLSLRFLGAAGTVTGSRHLLTVGDRRILVDCGLFQGFKQFRQRNWAPFPVHPSEIDAVVLTHAHIDHSGYLPLLIRNGFQGVVHCTRATADLCGVLLPDAGAIQEKDAERANRYGYTKHKPALPLYTEADARRALERLQPIEQHEVFESVSGVTAMFRPAGHILGAATVEIRAEGRTIAFSGDLGRYDDPIMPDPEPIPDADVLVMESTYGDRLHARGDPGEEIAQVVRETFARDGVVLIPSFAVGRAQLLMYHLEKLRREGRIPDIPVYLDSPMAADATDIFLARHDDHRLTAAEARRVCAAATCIQTPAESKALNADRTPKIIISASGMATGGRVLHHLKVYAPDPRNTILFAGFQAGGTRGADMTEGAERIRIHGDYFPVRAQVRNLGMLSAHADQGELLRWLGGFHKAPSRIFLVHGEPRASEHLRVAVGDELRWDSEVPVLFDEADL